MPADRAGKFDAEAKARELAAELALDRHARIYADTQIAEALREAFEVGAEASLPWGVFVAGSLIAAFAHADQARQWADAPGNYPGRNEIRLLEKGRGE